MHCRQFYLENLNVGFRLEIAVLSSFIVTVLVSVQKEWGGSSTGIKIVYDVL